MRIAFWLVGATALLLASPASAGDTVKIDMAEADRDPASMPITIWGAKENLDLLQRDRDDGVSRLVVSFDSGKADTILPELDRWATLIHQLGS